MHAATVTECRVSASPARRRSHAGIRLSARVAIGRAVRHAQRPRCSERERGSHTGVESPRHWRGAAGGRLRAQQRDVHRQRIVSRYLGYRRWVPVRVPAAQRRRLDYSASRQRDQGEFLGEGRGHVPRDTRGRLEQRHARGHTRERCGDAVAHDACRQRPITSPAPPAMPPGSRAPIRRRPRKSFTSRARRQRTA